ncbi:hypothetical protein QBC39DRAFT_368393 [Podospora conica]|nr:hypothetical protein QBC39DRAFT_368393 [Schizothecium conicum]
MAVFVDLDDEDGDPPQDGQLPRHSIGSDAPGGGDTASGLQPTDRENPNQNTMTRALGCYPIIMSIAASIDLNTLDSLSRTCRQIRADVLQYRKMLLVSTLHCSNEHVPVDPQATLQFRTRATNLWYMEDARRPRDTKAGECARDMVSECRRCGTVVCRNCAIKPPAPIVYRERHRRLCNACVRAPLGSLVKPPLSPELSVASEPINISVCHCESRGVMLCQPCGRGIRSDDNEYRSIWKWRHQYTSVLGGLGTGIGDGDRGVPCGRAAACCAGRDREEETDCDAADAARDAADNLSNATATTNGGSPAGAHATPTSSPWSSGASSISPPPTSTAEAAANRTPSPQLGPGYARHEIEGIGGVMKRKLLRMVKVGACVPEWDDERARADDEHHQSASGRSNIPGHARLPGNDRMLWREVTGQRRSWCGWCCRVIPGGRDLEEIRQPTVVLPPAGQVVPKGRPRDQVPLVRR